MARAPNKTHNMDLTRDEQADLLAYHLQKIRIGAAKVEQAAAALKLARAEVNGQFKLVDKDLGLSRLKVEDLMDKQEMGAAAFALHEQERADLYDLGGLPVGTQGELKLGAPDTADDLARTYDAGVLAAQLQKDRAVPGTVPTNLHSDWLRGWDDGHKQITGMIARAEAAIKEREARPKPGAVVADPDQTDIEDGVDGDLTDEQIAAKAKALVAGGFTEPTAAETDEPAIH